ncbi:MAG: ferrochelatase [Labilithrix sp.]|nr:ferrochelatase [Labilithrix sp.]MCW5817031.1 ferrochelatase [Labilithrix sp.]
MTKSAVVLIAHGTVEALDDLPELLRNIRRGHAAPPELLAEVRRRYEAIGGRSPLLDVTRSVATRLEARVGMPVRVAMRLFHPYPKDVLAALAKEGVTRVYSVPLAQHSAGVYGAAMTAAAKELAPALDVINAPNWGRTPELTRAFADAILAAPPADALVLTAHSLPVAIVRGGDPYETEMRASAEAVVAEVAARGRTFRSTRIAFQSQGIGTNMEWLGPDLEGTLRGLAEEGTTSVLVAPIGFLADHVEILYDLDIEAKTWAESAGMTFYRSASLNDGDGLVAALTAVVGRMTT